MIAARAADLDENPTRVFFDVLRLIVLLLVAFVVLCNNGGR